MNQGVRQSLKWGLGLLTVIALNACSSQRNGQTIDSSANDSVGEAIVGGTEVPAGNPIIKSIVAVYDSQLGALCTGSLLPNNIVMTAAHCINETGAEHMVVMFDIKLGGTSVSRQVDKAQVSPYWASNQNFEKNTGDIALIHFVGDVPAGYEAATFLPNKSSLKKDAPVVLAGFGISNGKTHEGAGILRVANVTVFDENFSISEVKLDQTKGQGACHGDSGGPAYLYADGKYYLWGITSRGDEDEADDCSKYSIYTNALSYKVWIKNMSKTLSTSMTNPLVFARN